MAGGFIVEFPAAGGSGSPAGVNFDLQFNEAGAFGAVNTADKVANLTRAFFELGFRGTNFYAIPNVGGTAFNTIGNTLVVTGTATAVALATTNTYNITPKIEALVTVAAATAVAGWRQAVNTRTIFGAGNALSGFFLRAVGFLATGQATTTRRFFMGLTNSTAAPTDVQPSSLLNIVGIGYDAADANLQVMFNDGTGVASKIDLGANFARTATDRTDVYQLELRSTVANQVQYVVTNLANNQTASGTLTTDLPLNTLQLSYRIFASVGGTSSVIGCSQGSLIFNAP